MSRKLTCSIRLEENSPFAWPQRSDTGIIFRDPAAESDGLSRVESVVVAYQAVGYSAAQNSAAVGAILVPVG